MCRSIHWALVAAVLGAGAPSVGMAAYQHPAGAGHHAAATPIRANGASWKAKLGTLKTYARAGHVHAARGVGSRDIQYAPSRYTIEGLLAKRALNPARFDLSHKDLGRLLARDARLRAAGVSGPYNGLLYPSAYHNYLRWRWGLNPARFEHYHQILGVILAEDHRLAHLTGPGSTGGTPSSPEIITPPPSSTIGGGSPSGGGGGTPPGISDTPPGIGGTPASGGGGGGPPVAVPEPGSIVLVAAGVTILTLHRARRSLRRRSGPSVEA